MLRFVLFAVCAKSVHSGRSWLEDHDGSEAMMLDADGASEARDSEAQAKFYGDIEAVRAAFQGTYFIPYKYFASEDHARLGSGQYGAVWKARYQEDADKNCKKVSCKFVAIKQSLSDASYKRDVEMLEKVKGSAFTVHLKEFKEQGRYAYIVLPMAKGAQRSGSRTPFFDLKTYADAGGTRLPPEEVKMLLAQVALSVRGVHLAKVNHFDIKPNNVLLDGNLPGYDSVPKALLTDFGVSEHFDGAKTYGRSSMGTALFMAPEVAENGIKTNGKFDWWSFGVLAAYVSVGGFIPAPERTRYGMFVSMVDFTAKNFAHWAERIPAMGELTKGCDGPFCFDNADLKAQAHQVQVDYLLSELAHKHGMDHKLMDLLGTYILRVDPTHRAVDALFKPFSDLSGAFWQHEYWEGIDWNELEEMGTVTA